MTDEETIKRLNIFLDHAGGTEETILKKYAKLLDFVQSLQKRTCCSACKCIQCDAFRLLIELREDK